MDEREIRIPVTIELYQTKDGETKAVKQVDKKPKEQKPDVLDMSSLVNTQIIMGTTRKLMAANGNTQSAKNLGLAMKFGNMGAGLIKGIKSGKSTNFGIAAVAIALEALEQVVKANAEAKQNRQIKNQTLYNQVFRGEIWLDDNVQMTYNKYGDLQFSRK